MLKALQQFRPLHAPVRFKVTKIVKIVKPKIKEVQHIGYADYKGGLCRPAVNKGRDSSPFLLRDLVIRRGNPDDIRQITEFLNDHFWTMEPTVTTLSVPIRGEYLRLVTCHYATSIYRWLAVTYNPRTGKEQLLGVAVGSVMCPWYSDELDQWANAITCVPSRNRIHFCAHMAREPKLFDKFDTNVIFELEVLAVHRLFNGYGIGLLLTKHAMANAFELRFPLVQIVATSYYTAKICQKLNMQAAYTLPYSNYTDDKGFPIFRPRKPHLECTVYVKKLPKKLF